MRRVKNMDFAAIVAIVVGLTQIFKYLDFPERITPLFAVAAGILVTLAANSTLPIMGTILVGIVAGLSAIGAYKVGTEGVLGTKLSQKLKISKTNDSGMMG